MNNASSQTPSDPLVEVAAHWCMRLHAEDCTDEERAQFKIWIEADPSHALEYAEMLEIWDLSEHLPPTQPSPRLHIPRQLPPPPPNIGQLPVRQRPRGFIRRHARALVLALIAAPLAGYSGWLAGWLPDSYQRFEAENGIRRITLPDGSDVELNLATRLSYANFIDRRRVSLDSGEAYFHVSHDSAHPFVVNAGEGSITVTGTRFNVWKYQDNIVVTVTEGSVKVRSEQRGNDSNLTPGMQASFKAGDMKPRVGAVDTQQALAWRDGKLILDDLTLAEAVPLINRYLDAPLVLGDQASADQRIGGIYSTRDIRSLVTALPRVLPINLAQQADGSTLISNRKMRL